VIVEAVFEYRTLLGKIELGCGLDWDEIDRIAEIEQEFDPLAYDGRRFRRVTVELGAMMRGDQINDIVEVVELGPGGLVCRHCPFIARGEIVEVTIDDGDVSYRFSGKGVWLRDDDEDYSCGLAFVGMPVRLHKLRLSEHHRDLVDRIASAA
jgi:hypothetical protein